MNGTRATIGRPSLASAWYAGLTLAGIAGFTLAMLVATDLYPGGTWLEPYAPSHEFWANFWCDLLRDSGHNGLRNLGRPWARIGMFSLALALGAFWGSVAALVRPGIGVRVMRAFGVSAALGFAIVISFPSDHYPLVHRLAITLTGPLGILAAVFAVVRLFLEPGSRARRLARLGAFTLIGALVNLVQFVRQMYFGSGESLLLSASQKVTTLALLVWMGAVAVLTLRASWPSPEAPPRAGPDLRTSRREAG